MFKRSMSCAAVLVAALCVPTLRADDKPSAIELLAPENSVFIFGATNVASSMERLKGTRLWAFWDGPDGKTLRDRFDQGMKDVLEQMSTELDMDVEEFPMPSGAAGFAFFTVENDDTGMTIPGVLAYADFGADAEQVYEIVKKTLEQGVEAGDIELEDLTFMDRDGWRIEFVEHEEDAADDDMNGEEDWENWDAGAAKPPFEAIEFIKEGSMLMICTDHAALEQALRARDGEDVDSVGDRDDYKAVKQKIGEGEMYGALLMRDFWQALGALQGEGDMGMAMMVGPMMEQMLGRIDGAGWTIGINGSNAMVEQTWFVHMPAGKKGLLSLIGSETGRPRVPSFVTPEAATYFSINIEPSAIGPFVRQMMQMPMLGGGGGMDQQTMEDVERRINEVFATMGHELHLTTRFKRPLSGDSQRFLLAIKCEKPQEFENLISKEADSIGLEPRDFLGQRIYELDPGMGATLSLGIGGGYVIAGPSDEVELALRAAGANDPTTLEGDVRFKRIAMALGADKGVAWGFADLIESIDAGMRMQILTMREQAEQYREWSPEFADDMLKSAEEMEKELQSMPSAETLRRYVGATGWYVRSIDEGLIGKSFIMSGGEE